MSWWTIVLYVISITIKVVVALLNLDCNHIVCDSRLSGITPVLGISEFIREA